MNSSFILASRISRLISPDMQAETREIFKKNSEWAIENSTLAKSGRGGCGGKIMPYSGGIGYVSPFNDPEIKRQSAAAMARIIESQRAELTKMGWI